MSAHGCFKACPEERYCAALAPMQISSLFPNTSSSVLASFVQTASFLEGAQEKTTGLENAFLQVLLETRHGLLAEAVN